jgi:hypothetical protein
VRQRAPSFRRLRLLGPAHPIGTSHPMRSTTATQRRRSDAPAPAAWPARPARPPAPRADRRSGAGTGASADGPSRPLTWAYVAPSGATPRPGRRTPSGDGPASPSSRRAAAQPAAPLPIAPPPPGRSASCGLRGTCSRPRASCPPWVGLRPHESCGGLSRPETLPRGSERGEKGLAPLGSASARPRPIAPPPPASASMPRGVGPPRATPPPAFGRASLACPFRAGPRRARAPRPPPARAAAGRPWPSRRGLHRAASMRPVCLIIHIFTVPEIPYFTGFSSRQAL